jgi:hypothetical protein
MTQVCVHCDEVLPSEGGYCASSPTGYHAIEDDPDEVNPYLVCVDCGVEMSHEEHAGYIEHICDPERVIAYKAWLNDSNTEIEWDYQR